MSVIISINKVNKTFSNGEQAVKDFSLDIKLMLMKIEEFNPAIIFLAFPNNPTANLWSKKDIDLIFGPKNLQLVEEVISSNEVGWTERNQYWLDDSNFVWKSVQSISPRLPKIYIEVTKKPSL